MKVSNSTKRTVFSKYYTLTEFKKEMDINLVADFFKVINETANL